jgi:hypothetical protein
MTYLRDYRMRDNFMNAEAMGLVSMETASTKEHDHSGAAGSRYGETITPKAMPV